MTIVEPNDFTSQNLSLEIAEAARDLANRINLGEFDDLDEGALADLRGLSEMMAHWATVAHALEQLRPPGRAAMPGFGSIRPTAFRN